MVIGGNQNQTEVIDLSDSSLTCTSAFGELESERKFAVGGFIDGTPILCGGEDIPDCLVFSHNAFHSAVNLMEKRHRSASVLLNESTLWILGGYGCDNSTELITLVAGSSFSGPELPMELDSACAVKFNDSHIYLTGGYHSSDASWADEVWIYNIFNSLWTKGPSLLGARSAHGCTVFHRSQQTSLVAVAGGWNNDTALDSVEILDPNMNKWVQGETENIKKT